MKDCYFPRRHCNCQLFPVGSDTVLCDWSELAHELNGPDCIWNVFDYDLNSLKDDI